MLLLARARGLLFTPRATWDAIAAEGDTTRWLWRRYLPMLAVLQAGGFLIAALLAPGEARPQVRTIERFRLTRDGSLEHIGTGTSTSLLNIHDAFQAPLAALFAFVLMGLYVLIARWLMLRAAPLYGAVPDRAAATKLAAYAQTGPAVAAIFAAVPWIGPFLSIVSIVHALALFHLGAPRLLPPMPEERQRFGRVAIYRAVASGIFLFILASLGSMLLGLVLLPFFVLLRG